MTDFIPTVRGITAFVEANRIDFVVNGPEMQMPERTSIYFEPTSNDDVLLEGEKLQILPAELDADGNVVDPGKLRIKWGRRVLTLGHRKNAAGPMSFYRSLETANDSARPQTLAQLHVLLGNVHAQDPRAQAVPATPADTNDEISF